MIGMKLVVEDAGEGWTSEIPLGVNGSLGSEKSQAPSGRRMAIRISFPGTRSM